jgi:hypothetical protein
LEETKFRRLDKSETPELLNTNPLGNSLLILMVYFTTPNGQRLRSYNYRNMAGLLNSGKNGQT